MNEVTRICAAAAFAATGCFTGSADAALMVDITGSGTEQGPLQPGYTEFIHENDESTTMLIPVAGDPDGVQVTISGTTLSQGFRTLTQDPLTGDLASLSDLLIDFYAPRNVGSITVLLESVMPGTYTYTSWHHNEGGGTVQDGPSVEVSVNGVAIDGPGNDLTSTEGVNPTLVGTFTTNVTVDESGTLTVVYDGGTDFETAGIFPINGFVLVPEPASLALLGLGGLVMLRRRA